MDEYTPIDLMTFHNAGLELLAEQGTALIGPQEFRGLPFLVGTNPQHCFVAFGEGLQHVPLSISIDQNSQSVIVAHRLLVSGISAGGPVGEPEVSPSPSLSARRYPVRRIPCSVQVA